MSKEVYRYRHVENNGERPVERSDRTVHSEIITLYDTERNALEKVAIIHNDYHFGGRVNGIDDPFPYGEDLCPCQGGKPPVKVWNGQGILLVPFEGWAENPEVPVLYLNRERNRGNSSGSRTLSCIYGFFQTLCRKAGLM